MPGREPIPVALVEGHASTLTDDEFAARFNDAARVLWTIAAGVLGNSADADDVLQEACVMALTKLDQYRPGTHFTAWMGQFVRNVALNHARKRHRRATIVAAPEVFADVEARDARGATGAGGSELPIDARGELVLDQAAFDDEVLVALRGLSTVQRSCLLLRSVLDLSYREIAQALELPEGTAMSHVHRARTFLRERLAPGIATNELERRA